MSDSLWPHQAPLSMGFPRQECWSGLPFPSPIHESEKWKQSCAVVSNSSRPHGLQPTRLLRPWDLPGKSTGVACHCLLQMVQECSLFSTPFPALIVCRVFDDGQSDRCEVISHCSFDLHFSNNEQCWTSFHVFVSHLYVFFGEMPV